MEINRREEKTSFYRARRLLAGKKIDDRVALTISQLFVTGKLERTGRTIEFKGEHQRNVS